MAFQFKIQLKKITNPPVWRRVIIPENFTFQRLHHVIQYAFGWTNSHLFQFSPGGYGSKPVISIPMEDEDWDEKPLDAKKIKLNEIFTAEKQKLTYLYDFGDDWFHLLTLEKITPDKIIRAECIDGKGACPPEDCGGPWGYANLKKIFADPKHPEHNEMKEWLGMTKKEKWNAAAFDPEETRKWVVKV
jgi:hypothetical protein